MKTYEDYTNEELLELSDDQVNELIDLQCAINKVPLLPEMPQSPVEPNIEPDRTIYKIGEFYFAELESAQKVMTTINEQALLEIDYDWRSGDRTNYVSGYAESAAKFETMKVFSHELYEKTKSERAKYSTEKERYDKLKKEYDSISNQRSDIAGSVWGAVSNAVDARNNKQDAMKRFDKYVELADGDKKLAEKFFCDAYPNDVHYLGFEIPQEEPEPEESAA